MSNAAENPYAPPTAHVADVAQGGMALGGRGERLGAVLIDGLIQAAIYYALAFTVFRSLVPDPGNAISAAFFSRVAIQYVVSFVLFVALQGYWLATQGQTIGKKLLGLRIVRSDGTRASLARLLGLRYLLGWVIVAIPVVGSIYGLVDALLIFRRSHKCLHDNIADTIVVRA